MRHSAFSCPPPYQGRSLRGVAATPCELFCFGNNLLCRRRNLLAEAFQQLQVKLEVFAREVRHHHGVPHIFPHRLNGLHFFGLQVLLEVVRVLQDFLKDALQVQDDRGVFDGFSHYVPLKVDSRDEFHVNGSEYHAYARFLTTNGISSRGTRRTADRVEFARSRPHPERLKDQVVP